MADGSIPVRNAWPLTQQFSQSIFLRTVVILKRSRSACLWSSPRSIRMSLNSWSWPPSCLWTTGLSSCLEQLHAISCRPLCLHLGQGFFFCVLSFCKPSSLILNHSWCYRCPHFSTLNPELVFVQFLLYLEVLMMFLFTLPVFSFHLSLCLLSSYILSVAVTGALSCLCQCQRSFFTVTLSGQRYSSLVMKWSG